MNIIQKKWEFLNSTTHGVPPQLKKLYVFGLRTLAARDIRSLRASARLMDLNWHTAKAKSYRLTQNPRIASVFLSFVTAVHPVHDTDCVNVDFSDFGNGFQVLLFAKQTRRGRAIPLFFDVIQYPIPKDSQNLFIERTIVRFYKTVHAKPTLVFDRGFASPFIVRFLKENQWQFVIRVKAGKHVVDPATHLSFASRSASKGDQSVLAYGASLRLVVSNKKEGMDEPWYLVTNDFVSSRERIIDTYYHRFEIEEFFRDAKRLLGLEPIYFKTKATLVVVLWFTILGVWCLTHLAEQMEELKQRQRNAWRLSAVRYCFEKLSIATLVAAEGMYLHSYDV